jgi:hypothetical protein
MKITFGHIEGVELVETGTWPASTGPFTCTSDHISSSIAALGCPAVRRPVLKAGHDGQHGVGEPALGWCDNLRSSNAGQTLVCDFRGMPAWLTHVDDDGNSVMTSAYPDRSIEGEKNYRCTLGHTHPFVVHAVALLGVERPAGGTLESLQELYGLVQATTATSGGEVVAFTTTRREAQVPQHISASATDDDVFRAYYDGPGSSWDLWIRELYIDPMELIVDNDATNEVWRVPYMLDAAGMVTFGDPQVVKITYVAARAASTPALTAFATRTESRPGQCPALATPKPSTASAVEPGTAGATTTQEKEVGMSDTLIDGLRKQLGLAAEADEATVLAANAEALSERATAPATPTPVAPLALPDGTVAVDAATWQEQVAATAQLGEWRTAQLQERREGLVAAAVADGRIAPVRKDHWLASLKADDGAETVLASLAKGTVPIVELGHSGADTVDTAEGVRATDTYKNWSTG